MSDVWLQQLWSVTLTVIGLAGMLLVGRRRRAGWLVLLGLQVLWLGFALVFGHYGFIGAAAAYAAIYLWNWRRWRDVEVAATRAKVGVDEGVRALGCETV